MTGSAKQSMGQQSKHGLLPPSLVELRRTRSSLSLPCANASRLSQAMTEEHTFTFPRRFQTRHCEPQRSNPSGNKASMDCFVAIAPRNDAGTHVHLPAALPNPSLRAKRSNPCRRAESMDCVVACAPRNDGFGSAGQITPPRSSPRRLLPAGRARRAPARRDRDFASRRCGRRPCERRDP